MYINRRMGGIIMPTPLPEGVHIIVERKRFEPDYAMPSMEMATDHYSVGYVISGDRKTITPKGTYSYHAGETACSPPYVYHRTLSCSDQPYERILIKFTPDFSVPFIENVGQQIFDELFERRISGFSEEVSEKIKELFLDMEEIYRTDKPYKEFILQGMLCYLLTRIWEEGHSDRQEPGKTSLTPPIVDAVSYIESFYASDPSLERIAREVNLSPAYFSRLFHEQMGKSYSEYLNNVKLRHVCILLTRTRKTIMEIAQETGFCHGNYLSQQFKRKTGMTPAQFRKKNIV